MPNRVRVLLVDDDAALLRAFERNFGKRYAVATVDSGEAALAYLAARPVDVAVVDYSMPGMSGIDLVRTIAANHPTVGRLMLTAYAELPEVVALRAAELVAAILPKPWDRDELEAAIAKAVRLSSMRRAVQSMKTRMQPG